MREELSTNRDYFVDDGGSDCNDGLSIGQPFASLQHAVDTASRLDLFGYDVTINVAPGTYTGFIPKHCVGNGSIIIQGDNNNPENQLIGSSPSPASPPGFTRTGLVWGLNVVTPYYFHGVRFANAAVDDGLWALGYTTFFYGNVIFGATDASHVRCDRGFVKQIGDVEIDGNTIQHIQAVSNGMVETDATTITLTGTPAFTRFAIAMQNGNINIKGMTFNGSATGSRYRVLTNGVIDTANSGANYLPGNSAGVTLTGGQYI